MNKTSPGKKGIEFFNKKFAKIGDSAAAAAGARDTILIIWSRVKMDTTSENHLMTHVLVSCNLCFLSHVPILMSHVPCLDIYCLCVFSQSFFVSFLTSSVSYPTSPVLHLLS